MLANWRWLSFTYSLHSVIHSFLLLLLALLCIWSLLASLLDCNWTWWWHICLSMAIAHTVLLTDTWWNTVLPSFCVAWPPCMFLLRYKYKYKSSSSLPTAAVAVAERCHNHLHLPAKRQSSSAASSIKSHSLVKFQALLFARKGRTNWAAWATF